MEEMENTFKTQMQERDLQIRGKPLRVLETKNDCVCVLSDLTQTAREQDAKLSVQNARLEGLTDVEAQRDDERESRLKTQKQNAKLQKDFKAQGDYLA